MEVCNEDDDAMKLISEDIYGTSENMFYLHLMHSSLYPRQGGITGIYHTFSLLGDFIIDCEL